MKKNVLIVGASRPWAPTLADALASEARVVLLKDPSALDAPPQGAPSQVTGEHEVASAVVEAAEETGGFDLLLWGPRTSSPAELWLDVEPESWGAMLDELREVHLVLRCALPYLLGRPSSLVLLGAIPGESVLPPHRAVRSCVLACLGDHLRRELALYGVAVHAWTLSAEEGAPEGGIPSSMENLQQRMTALLHG